MDLKKVQKYLVKTSASLFLFAGVLLSCPKDSLAAAQPAEVQTRSSYMVTIEAPTVDVFAAASDSSDKQGQVRHGQTYEVLSGMDKGWVKIRTGGREGYIKTSGKASIVEKSRETVDLNVKKRRQVVEFALQFLGGTYVYGGTDPNKGVDCSGFTRYILGNTAAVVLPHSAAAQSAYGTEVTEEDMRPGDLIFYSNDTRINHVAMYIGDGQVVHASTEETGIKLSPYNYRLPVKIISLLS